MTASTSFCWSPEPLRWYWMGLSWTPAALNADRSASTSAFWAKSSVSCWPPVKSTPKFAEPRWMPTASETAMTTIDRTAAGQRLPMKSIFDSLTHCVIFRLCNRLWLSRKSNTMRVPTMAVYMLAMMPAVSVTAKPFTGPEPCQNRITAVSSVVRFESKIVVNALS